MTDAESERQNLNPNKIEGRGRSLDQLRFFTKQLENSISRAQNRGPAAAPGYTQHSQKLLREISEQMPEAINTIRSALQDMNNLSNGIRTLGYLDTRPLSFALQDCNEIMSQVVRTNNLFIETNRVNVSLDHLDNVVADKQSLHDIFQGLFDNALKYLDPVRRGEISVSSHQDHSYTTFRLQDNGRGIADSDIDRVYDVFKRSDEVVHISGEGMGIPYVQILVRRHHGNLWFTSEPGVGTIFYFTIDNHLS